MHKFIAALIIPTFIALLALWTSAAKAETWLEGPCTARPMAQGKAGEWVTTCELTRVASKVTTAPSKPSKRLAKPRTGRTTVVARLGARSPVRAVVARLDADGTCGGLPSACCSVLTGSPALCGKGRIH